MSFSPLYGDLQVSLPNDILVEDGNGLAIFLDSDTNLLTLRDSRGVIQKLDTFIISEGITEVIAGCCLTGGGTSPTITLNHADTSSLDGFYGQPSPQDGCYIKSVTVDGLGHLTAVTSDNFDTRYLGINACACDSAELNSENPDYYLNFCNFFNVPALGDITEICAGDGLGGGGSSGVVSLCNTDKGSNQNIVKRFVGNCGNTYTAQSNNDLLCIVGSGSVTTCFDGNKVIISSTNEANNCQVEIEGGDGISGGGCFNLNQPINSVVTVCNSDKGSSQNIFKNVAVSGQSTITAGSNTSTLNIVEGSGMDITTCSQDGSLIFSSTVSSPSDCQIQITATDGLSGNATFTLNQGTNGNFTLCNSDKGSDQCFFQNINVVGSCTVSAGLNDDTLCLSAGSGIILVSNPTTKSITISSSSTPCTGTVTEVCVESGTTGTDFNVSGSPINTSGTIILNLPTASATNRGALSSADWTAFNSKTSCLGTVTNVGFCTAEGGTDINVSGSPITNSGDITLNIPVASATKTGKLSSTDWSDFNNKVDDVTAGSGISVSGADTIEVTNIDKGSDQCIFKTFSVSGQDDIVADSNSDTVTFAGSGIAITTDDTTDTMTFTVTDAGGTVTEICGAVGSTGTDFNVTGSPITNSGTLTFNLPDSSATSRGALTSADWTTFNNKTNCTGTLTSVQINGCEGIVASGTNPITSSGAINLAICLNELSTGIDNDCGCYFAVVDNSGVQTKLTKSNINNSGFNNDAGYTNCGGTVTSVGLSAGLGVAVTGSPITGSGTMTVTNTDRGSEQCIFKCVAVTGQTTIEADSNTDTLTFAEGTGITITTNNATDTVTISNEGADGTVTCVNFETNETGTDVSVSGSPITTDGTITLSIPEASATNTGKLTATDWSTFNSKTDCTGTVTSIGLCTGTTGTDINVTGTPVTGSGDITLNIPNSSATTRGALTSADWSTFNSKTDCTGTVTSVAIETDELGTDVSVAGSPITGDGTVTISIPEASSTNTGKLTSTDWSSFNSKTSCTGTVESVGALIGTAGTDFNVSGSPITDSGDITFNLPTASATNRGALSSADWTAFNSKTSCTGTVTSIDITTDELGTDVSVSGSPITSDGTVTISIPEASATNTGKLTSTDWSSFNSKTDCLGTVTSLGLLNGGGLSVSGSPITSSGDITVTNIDKGSDQCIFKNFAVSGEDTITADTNNDTVTFAGQGIAITTDDTTDTLTFTVTDAGGTVTEICADTGLTGTDFNITGSPITSAGTLTFNLPTANATNTGKLSATDWTDFNNKVDNVTAGAGICVSGTDTIEVTNCSCIFKSIASTGQSTLIANSLTDTLNIEAGTGVSIQTDDSSDTLTITNTVVVSDCIICIQAGSGLGGGGDFGLNQTSGETVSLSNTDKGSSQCIFKCIAVTGETTIEADSNADTLTFVGDGIAITNNASTDTVTFKVTDAGGTVTCVGAVACTTGTDISVTGSPITNSGEFCINIPTASATNRGALSSSDWSTFNSKTTCTGTVTSVSGGTGLTGTVTISGNIEVDYAGTDNIIASSTNCTGTTPSTSDCLMLSRQADDNVVHYELADLPFSNCAGSVTQVCGAVGTTGLDFNVTGSPITGSGTLTFNLPNSSATTRGALTCADWTTFNNKTDCTGTVTSVGIINGGGIGVTGSPITGSGDITLENIDKGSSQSIFKNIIVSGQDIVTAETNNDSLTFIAGTNMSITTNCTLDSITFCTSASSCTGTVTSVGVTAGTGISVSGSPITSSGSIEVCNIDKGSDQCIFKNFAVSGEDTIVADSNNDTITFVGDGIAITNNASTDTMTFKVTDAGGTVTCVCTTSPITGGDFSDIGTIGITQSNTTTDGYLSSTDWNTFNNKTSCTMSSWRITGDSGTSASVEQNCEVTIQGGTGITTSSNGFIVDVTNTDRGSSQCIFKCFAVSGQNTIEADSNTDTLTIVGGDNVTLTTDNSTDTLTICTISTTCTGTVTSVALTTDEVGTDVSVSGSPITDNGVINLSIPEASATNTGKLTATDWTTFNNKTSCTGTVSSIGITAGTGISVSGSPITSSGSISVCNIDKGSSQCIFKSIAVSGEDTIQADSNADTLTFVGSGIQITTDDTTDTITFTNTDAGGTVTEVCAQTGTTGTDFVITGSPITTNGTLTFNLPVASASATGKLSSTDWNTFNNKTDCTGTVTGVTGDGGLCGSVTGSGSICVDYAGVDNVVLSATDVTGNTISSNDKLLISCNSNGNVGYFCVSDLPFSNCSGTVTSVGVTAGTGISVSGSPITSSGSITVCNTDKGSSQCIFKTFSVSGQDDIVADSNSDTVTFAGSGIAITTDDTTDTMTFTVTDAGGTVTEICGAVGSTGTDFNVTGSPITDSGTLTFNLPTASTLNRGALSSADWSTFNNKIDGVVATNGLSGGGTSGTVTVCNSDRGSAQDIFKRIAVSGQGTVIADSNDDILTLVGSGVTITTNTATDTITFTATQGDITGVTGSGGLCAGGTFGAVTICADYSGADNIILSSTNCQTTSVSVSDFVMISCNTNNVVQYHKVGELPFTNCSGDITGVTAGDGLTGGGTSGTVTLDVGAGTGISVNSNTVDLDISSLPTVVPASNDFVAGYDQTGESKFCISDIIALVPQGDITGVTAGTGLSGGGTSGTVTVCNADKGSSQNIFKNVASDSGTAVADNNNDTLTISGGTNITTAVSGDTLTINSSGTSCTGTVTQVCGAVGTSGTDFSVSGSPITGSGTLTFNLPTASATNTGKLSSTDWVDFDKKVDDVTAGNGISVSGSDTIQVTNNDRGSSQSIFKNVAVSGQSTVVADNNNDTLTLVAGSNISLSTNATSDSITITSTAPTGDITSVTGSGGLCAGGTSGAVTICADYSGTDNIILSSPFTATGTLSGSDTILFNNGGNCVNKASLSLLPFSNCSGTVTSLGLCTGTSGTDINVSNTPITSNGNITLNIPTASSSNRGALNSVDWTKFNNKTTCTGTVSSVSANAGSGINITGDTTITTSGAFSVSNTDRGSSQSIFKNFAVSGQSTVVADNNNDTLTLVAGTNISLSTNATSDSITITSTTPTGDITGVTAGTGLCGGGTSGTVTVNVDYSGTDNYLYVASDDIGSAISTSDIINVSNTSNVVEKHRVSDLPFTNCSGDITGVTAGTGISGGGTSGSVTVTNSDRGSSQSIFKNFAVSGQSTVVADNNNDTLTLVAGSNISLSTNATSDSITITSTAPTGDITGVTAGTGMTGGGSSGSVTLNVIGGDGITANADNIVVDSTVVRTSGTQTIGGIKTFSDNLGIGVTPTVKFQVAGSSKLGGSLNVSSDGNFNTNAVYTFRDGVYINNPNDTSATSSANTVMSIGGMSGNSVKTSLITTGAIGIGTSAPNRRLHVVEASNGNIALFTNTIDADLNINLTSGVTMLTPSTGTLAFGTSSTERMRINSDGAVLINATSVRGSASKLSVQGGMSEFETTLTNENDWANSPISILERGNIGSGSADDKYSPNLNFHWSGRVSNSLWMSDNGHLNWGSYTSLGVPSTDGVFRTKEINLIGTGRITGVDTVSASTDATNKAYVDNAIAGTGSVTQVCGAVGTSGTDFSVSGSPITGSGTLTFNLPSASASNRGALTSSDWTDFNNKVDNVTSGTGISVSGSDTIQVTNTDRGSSQCIFKTFIVSGQNSINADSNSDAVTLVGSGVTITTNSATDTITFTATQGDITGVTGSGGLCAGGTSGAVTICADYSGTDNIILSSPSTATGTLSGNDIIMFSQSGTNNVLDSAISNLPFSNCQGDITGVTATNGLSGGGTSGTVTVCNSDRGSSQNIFKNVASNSGTAVADNNNDTLTISGGTNITTAVSGDTLTINTTATTCQGDITGITAGTGISGGGTSGSVTVTNSDRGSSQSIFKNVAVSGQSTVVADNNNDTLTLVAGSNISLSTNASSDSITITSTAPTGDITGVTAGTGMTGGGSSGSVTLNVIGGDGITANADNIVVDSTVVRTSGTQTIGGLKTFSDNATFSGITTFNDHSIHPDQVKSKFGNNGDLEIYHDGSNSYIKDTGTGTLNIQGSTQVLISGTNGEVGVQYVENAGVGLRHNNVTKLTTTSTGVTVTGDVMPSAENLYDIGSASVRWEDIYGDQVYGRSVYVDEHIYHNGDTNTYIQFPSTNDKIVFATNGSDVLTLDATNTATFAGDLTVSGGDITLSGTGRIQGVDTVSASTDATNKAYVDNAIAGVPQGDITGVTAGTGISGGGTSGTVTVTNSDRGSSQNIFKNVASNSGTAVADNNNDTLTISGGTNVTTAVSGDTLTINTSATSCTGTVTGTGTSKEVAFWSTSTGITSDSGFTYDSGNADLFVNSQYQVKAGVNLAQYSVKNDTSTGLGHFDGVGQVGLVSSNKVVFAGKGDKNSFNLYTASAVATTGSLSPNQSQQALTSDTLANLTVDPTGNIVRGSQEGTWTFTKAQLDALSTSTTSGTTLLSASGTNKAVIVEESNLMLKYSGTGSMSTNSFVIRQGNNGDATAEITRLPSGQINTIMSSAPTNPTYGFYSRDLPLYNGDGRSFVTNKATFLTRINTNATPSNLISISIKLKYRIFNATTF